MKENKDLKFIKRLSKVTVSSACKKVGVNPSNLWAGRTTPDKIKKVKKQMIKDMMEVYSYE